MRQEQFPRRLTSGRHSNGLGAHLRSDEVNTSWIACEMLNVFMPLLVLLLILGWMPLIKVSRVSGNANFAQALTFI
jgi:hypothetical protein